jgi:outer membrane protein insertion porin family
VRRAVVALGVVAVLACPAIADEIRYIREIVVEGNSKTTSDTVEWLSRLHVGDAWTPDESEIVKARLVTSGLFQDVEVFWEPVQNGVRIHMIVTDKHSWVIAPAFYTQPTNIGGGVGYGENNLFGLNQKLLLYAQIATGDSFFVGAWQVPSIAGTHIYTQVDTYDTHSRVIEYANPTAYIDNPVAVRREYMDYYNVGLRVGYEFLRGLKLDTRLRAARVSYNHVELDTTDNPNVTNADLGLPAGAVVPKPGVEGWDVSNEWTATFDRRANWYGIASGSRYTLTFEHSVLSNDFHYYEFNATAFKAFPILESHNLVLKARADLGWHMPFQQEFETGGTSMRGWLNNQFRGDTRGLVNVEYSVPMFTVYGLSFRGLGFVDSAYTTTLHPDPTQRDYLPNEEVRGWAGFKNSVGVGTRLYLRQIVLPLLGLDFGYGLEARDYEIYLAVGLTD